MKDWPLPCSCDPWNEHDTSQWKPEDHRESCLEYAPRSDDYLRNGHVSRIVLEALGWRRFLIGKRRTNRIIISMENEISLARYLARYEERSKNNAD